MMSTAVKFVFLVSLVSVELVVSSVDSTINHEDEVECTNVNQAFTACQVHHALLTVNQTQDLDNLVMNVSSIRFIVPYAFKKLGIIHLALNFGGTYPNLPNVILWPDAFRGLPSLTSLFIVNAVFDFAWNPFQHLRTLTHLSVLYSLTNVLPPEFLGSLPHLRNFTLMKHNLTEITTSTFSSTSQTLEHLALYYGRIRSVQPKSFERLHHLKYLSLFANPLTNLQPGTFDGLHELEELDLRWTGQGIISRHLFDELRSLRRLKMSNSILSHIEPGSFDDLEGLQELDLSFNKLTTLVPGVFRGLEQLVVLNLARNNIGVIPNHVFNELTNLRELNLRSNFITSIEANAFSGLHLRNLSLFENPVYFVGVNYSKNE